MMSGDTASPLIFFLTVMIVLSWVFSVHGSRFIIDDADVHSSTLRQRLFEPLFCSSPTSVIVNSLNFIRRRRPTAGRPARLPCAGEELVDHDRPRLVPQRHLKRVRRDDCRDEGGLLRGVRGEATALVRCDAVPDVKGGLLPVLSVYQRLAVSRVAHLALPISSAAQATAAPSTTHPLAPPLPPPPGSRAMPRPCRETTTVMIRPICLLRGAAGAPWVRRQHPQRHGENSHAGAPNAAADAIPVTRSPLVVLVVAATPILQQHGRGVA